jgi:putative spermidine/putrescine transport system ATP-binding protein
VSEPKARLDTDPARRDLAPVMGRPDPADDFLVLDRLSAHEGGRMVLHALSLTLARGQRLALLGAPGAGTTACVQVLAGFRRTLLGHIRLAGRPITDASPHTRGIAAVFREDTVFPHLSVLDNVAFGLKLRGVRAAERQRLAAAELAALGASPLADRPTARLDPAERRVVALARAAVLHPDLLLVDEPATAADAPQRAAIRTALAAVFAREHVTCLLATHDAEAALALSDRVALLREGHLLQLATPQDLYERPASRYVAAFTGDCNVLAGTLLREGEAARFVLADGSHAPAQCPPDLPEGPALLAVRPGKARPELHGRVRGTVAAIAYRGGLTRVTLDTPEGPFLADLAQAPAGLARGADLALGWPEDGAWAMPVEAA